MANQRKDRSTQFLEVLKSFEHVIVVTHDNPDPDAISAGWAACYLIEQRLEKKTRFVARGAIVRAENARMVEVLKPPLMLLETIHAPESTAVVLVDCSPLGANHLLTASDLKALAVIDHHKQDSRRFRVAFRDIRPRIGASATILTQYLREQAIDPPPDLATALIYGIQTDTHGLDSIFSPSDRRALAWLPQWVDQRKLADIENAPLTRGYFGDLLLAFESTFVYEDVAICFLPRVSGPEIVGEVADLLIRCNDLNRVLCATAVEDGIVMSVRTSAAGGDAAEILEKAVHKLGHGGGHRRRAGGKVLLNNRGERTLTDLQSTIRNRWLEVCNVAQQRGSRLVPKREILEHL